MRRLLPAALTTVLTAGLLLAAQPVAAEDTSAADPVAATFTPSPPATMISGGSGSGYALVPQV